MKISINGPIVPDSYAWIYDYFEEPCTSPKKVIDALNEVGENEDVTIIVNSGGGSVYAASEIYHALKSHKGKVSAEVASIAASAASFLVMAADAIGISPLGQFMLHNASTYASGDYRDMDNASDMLKAVNASISKAYEIKTKLSKEEIKAMMDKETYLTAEMAVEKGFADSVLFIDEEHDFAADKGTLLPRAVIDDMMKRLEKGEFENVVNSKDNEKEEGGEKPMTYEEIKNNLPEVFEKIKNEGYEAGVKEENERMKNIDALASTGMEELLNKAKYEEPMNAGQLAIKILNKQAEIGQKHVQNVDEDAKDLEKVENTTAEDEENKKAQAAAKAAEGLQNMFDTGGVL